VQKADQIIFMQPGRILAQGTHEFLLDNCPEYAHLASLQFIDEA
jgi:ABC-type multidrug transport system fused ATPase/permease subunit